MYSTQTVETENLGRVIVTAQLEYNYVDLEVHKVSQGDLFHFACDKDSIGSTEITDWSLSYDDALDSLTELFTERELAEILITLVMEAEE